MDLTNLDELKQRELIKIWQLKREIKEATKDLEQLNESKEKIGKELKELKIYQDRINKKHQKDLLLEKSLEKKIEEIKNNLHKWEIQRKRP